MTKVNVILITYNQEKYIEQALHSILMQETTFAFDIIVADDCSTDATLNIIRQYANESNIKFIFLPNNENLGYIKNYQRAFAACESDYITIMEGDDFWNSPHHIQNHIAFLDNHSECSMCFNRHIRLFEDQYREEIPEWTGENNYQYFTTEQMIQGNKIGNLSCCTFRSELIKKLDPHLFDLTFADWLLGMIMGQYGYLGYLEQVTSTYRIHDNGQWSRMSETEQTLKMISQLKLYDKILGYKYTRLFARKIKSLEICLYGNRDLKDKIKHFVPDSLKKLYWKLKKKHDEQ